MFNKDEDNLRRIRIISTKHSSKSMRTVHANNSFKFNERARDYDHAHQIVTWLL